MTFFYGFLVGFLILFIIILITLVISKMMKRDDFLYENVQDEIVGKIKDFRYSNNERYVYDPVNQEITFISEKDKYYEDIDGDLWEISHE